MSYFIGGFATQAPGFTGFAGYRSSNAAQEALDAQGALEDPRVCGGLNRLVAKQTRFHSARKPAHRIDRLAAETRDRGPIQVIRDI